MCTGEFNEVLFDYEKKGGQVADFVSMQDFHNTLFACNLRDVRFVGYKYTWINAQKTEANIQERLVRCLFYMQRITCFRILLFDI